MNLRCTSILIPVSQNRTSTIFWHNFTKISRLWIIFGTEDRVKLLSTSRAQKVTRHSQELYCQTCVVDRRAVRNDATVSIPNFLGMTGKQ